jgi:integrase
MAGSIRLVSGKDIWELRVYVGRDSKGRIRHLHRRFQGTRRAAELELARMVLDQESSPPAVPEAPQQWGKSTTVNDAIAAWKSNGWEDLSPKTVIGYESVWHRYVEKSIGRRRISTLNAYEVEKYFRDLKRAGAGRDTVRHVRVLLNRACKLARKWSGGVLLNPVVDAELPSWALHERGPGVRSPEVAEVQALLKAAEDDDERMAAFVRVIAATGMRRGEACGLRWSCIDWDDGVLRIQDAIVTADGGSVVKPPKTRASIRTLSVDKETLDVLRELREHQHSLADVCEVPFSDNGFVFSYEPGGAVPPHPDSMSHSFSRIRAKAGVASDIHLHSLRHFQATVLDAVISERQKQARLGWTTSHIARHYTDAVAEEDRRAAEYVGKLLNH